MVCTFKVGLPANQKTQRRAAAPISTTPPSRCRSGNCFLSSEEENTTVSCNTQVFGGGKVYEFIRINLIRAMNNKSSVFACYICIKYRLWTFFKNWGIIIGYWYWLKKIKHNVFFNTRSPEALNCGFGVPQHSQNLSHYKHKHKIHNPFIRRDVFYFCPCIFHEMSCKWAIIIMLCNEHLAGTLVKSLTQLGWWCLGFSRRAEREI